MSVLLVILAAVLGLVLVVLLLILLLLCVRIGVDVVGVNGEVSAEVRYGPVRIPVWPPPRRAVFPLRRQSIAKFRVILARNAPRLRGRWGVIVFHARSQVSDRHSSWSLWSLRRLRATAAQ